MGDSTMELPDIGYVDMPMKCPKGTRPYFDPIDQEWYCIEEGNNES